MTKYKIGQLLTYIIPRREQQGLLQDAKLRIELLKEKKLEYETRHMNPRLNFEANDYQDPLTS